MNSLSQIFRVINTVWYDFILAYRDSPHR